MEDQKNIPSPRIQAHFDCLVDQFDENIHRDDIREELNQNINRFLAAGLDAKRIASMMSPTDIVKHYAALTRHGAEIDPLDLANAMTATDVYLNFGNLVSLGLDPNHLFTQFSYQFLRETAPGASEAWLMRHITTLIGYGVSPALILDEFENLLYAQFGRGTDEAAGKALHLLNVLLTNGLSKTAAQEWLNEAIVSDNYLLQYAFMYPQEIAPFALDLKPHIGLFLKRCGAPLIRDGEFDTLAKIVPIADIFNTFTLEDMDIVDPNTLDMFLPDFTQAGGDLTLLVQKFLTEIGYDGDSDHATMLMLLIDAAEDPAIDALIDFNQFAASIDTEGLEDYERMNFQSFFSEHGVPAEAIAKFQ